MQRHYFIMILIAFVPFATPVMAQHDPGAMELLDKVAERYRSAPAFIDNVTATMTSPIGKLSFEFAVEFDSDGRSRTRLRNDVEFTAIGTTLYVTRRYAAGRYVRQELRPNIIDGLATVMDGRRNVPIHHFLMNSEQPEDCLDRLTLGVLQGASFDRVSQVTKDGRELSRISLNASNGSATLTIDPKTHLIVSYELFGSMSMGGEQPQPVSALFEYRPQIVEKLEKPIEFEAGDMTQVRTLSALVPRVGDLAPPLELPMRNEEVINTADLLGSVIVLDFWSSWSGPCKVGLPMTDEYAKTIAGTGQAVRIFAVNIMEDGSREEIGSRVSRYWDRVKFSFPVLIDYAFSAARDYAATPPTTIVIGPDGRIVARHDRLMENKVQVLKETVAQALSDEDSDMSDD